jgi:F0F1-type ATP synthase membrane subunit c/vacuolar-type H+-ATPase subunit K
LTFNGFGQLPGLTSISTSVDTGGGVGGGVGVGQGVGDGVGVGVGVGSDQTLFAHNPKTKHTIIINFFIFLSFFEKLSTFRNKVHVQIPYRLLIYK